MGGYWNSHKGLKIGLDFADDFLYSITMTTHEELVVTAWELTRDAFGYKPNYVGMDRMSDDELRIEIDFLSGLIKREMESERQEELDHESAVERAMTVHSGFSIGELIGA